MVRRLHEFESLLSRETQKRANEARTDHTRSAVASEAVHEQPLASLQPLEHA